MKSSNKYIKRFLLILTVLAAVKMLLQSFSLDEEYQLMISYRDVMGDSMMNTMWEPHQTSSFLCTIFMWPYFKIFGTWTGVVIYLRLMGTLIHLSIAVYLYKILAHFLQKQFSFYLALIFFNTIPKLIMLPEFGGMQVWFGVLCFLLIIDSAEHITFFSKASVSAVAYGKIIAAAIFMCLEVLSYPSCALLFIPFIFMLWQAHKSNAPLRKCLVFTGTCGFIGGAYTGFFIANLGLDIFLRNIDAILSSDLTHTYDGGMASQNILAGLLQYLLTFLILTIFSFILVKFPLLRQYFPADPKTAVIGVLLLLTNIYQLYLWVIRNAGYEYLQIHLAVTLCLGLWFIFFKINPQDAFSTYMWFGSVIGLSSLVCVMLLTDLTLVTSIPHAMLGSICMLALFAHTAKECPKYITLLFIAFCFTACVGKGFSLRGGQGYNNVLQSENICRYGPAIGTISNYMGAHIYNNEYKLWQEEIPEGSKVLIATDNVHSTNTIQYTFKNAEVCHYSIVDPTAYDERLLTYWSYYPEKEPDIIVIDCWFGNMLFAEDSWIVQYIENDFGYSEVIDGDYVRIYKK